MSSNVACCDKMAIGVPKWYVMNLEMSTSTKRHDIIYCAKDLLVSVSWFRGLVFIEKLW